MVRFACLLYQKSIPDFHLTGLINFLQEGPLFSKNYTWDDLQLWLDAEMSGNNLEEELDLRFKEDKRKKMDLELGAFHSLQVRGRGQVRRVILLSKKGAFLFPTRLKAFCKDLSIYVIFQTIKQRVIGNRLIHYSSFSTFLGSIHHHCLPARH